MTSEYFKELKESWKREYAENDCKYIVLKMDDLMESLESYEDYLALNDLLDKYNKSRQQKGKGINKYFVANRDDYPFDTAEEFIDALNNFANIAL